MHWAWLAAAFLGVLAATAAATWRLLPILRRRGVLDRPNARSLHTTATPRGGGLAILGVLLPAWAAIAGNTEIAILVAGAALIAGVSWIDGRRELSPGPRLAAQAVAVAAVLVSRSASDAILPGSMPAWLDRAVAGLLWLWFLNLFNFMDGIDGLAGTEAASIGIGVAAVALAGGDALRAALGLSLAAAALGFLPWNWPQARLFLGDVGSIPLGYLIGWLLLDTAAQGDWAAAIILPAYFVADASATLIHRLALGHSLLEAHAEHHYQRAVRRGLGHGQVTRAVLVANLALIALAMAAARGETAAALVGAAAAVALLLLYLARAAPAGRSR